MGDQTGQVCRGIKIDSGYDYDRYMGSVRNMKNVGCDAVLPGHYGPCLGKENDLFQMAYRELLANRDRYR